MKRALVTGGSGVIGAAICNELASAGIEVIVHANSHAETAEAVAHKINENGGRASVCVFDVTVTDAAQAAMATLLEGGPVQIVINNAGIHSDAPMPGMSPAQWYSVIDVSLHGFFNVTQPLLLPMLSTRWGRIVAISSLAGVLGNRGQANYAAAKAGLHGAARSLSLELAPRGITVNVVAPGIIDSSMAAQSFTPEEIGRLVPMRRAGTPAEVAYLVGFLVSDRADYISGQIIGINGGIV